MKSWFPSAALMLLSGTAAASPSVWTKARDPERGRAEQTLVAAERMADYAAEVRSDAPYADGDRQRMYTDFMRAVVAELELAQVSKLPDPRLRFLYGSALVDIGRDESGRRALRRALTEAPDSPLAARAWFELAIASARAGDPATEFEGYTRALERTWEGELRAVQEMNRGESSMVAGRLRAAIEDYRRALDDSSSPETQALALWGLGVALERAGDLPSALEAVGRASQIRMFGIGGASVLDLPSVFFVPAYDVHYYKALGAMADSRAAEHPAEKKLDLEVALFEWDRYLEQAEPDAHVWVGNAKRLRARCERDLEKLKHERAPRAARKAPAR